MTWMELTVVRGVMVVAFYRTVLSLRRSCNGNFNGLKRKFGWTPPWPICSLTCLLKLHRVTDLAYRVSVAFSLEDRCEFCLLEVMDSMRSRILSSMLEPP